MPSSDALKVVEDARALLRELGAPERLLRHVELVGEAAELLLADFGRRGVPLDAAWVRAGVVLHDAGKVLHPEELERPGADHEPAGEALLRAHGVSDELARVCVTHARWSAPETTLEELLIALADTLWKGSRKRALEERVIDAAAERLSKPRWDLFVELDSLFEQIAADGAERLARSQG